MKYLDFRKKIGVLPLLGTKDLKVLFPRVPKHNLRNNLRNWVDKGYLVNIRRGFYIPADLAEEIDPMVIASKIYFPSYVSLEAALGYYGIIPEAVFTTTSVTTRKTFAFSAEKFGNFSYQKIKQEAFGGFATLKDNNISFNLALPEKALVDWFYINRNRLDGTKEQFLSFRFNEEFGYKQKKLLKFAKLFQNKKTLLLTKNFIEHYAAGKRIL